MPLPLILGGAALLAGIVGVKKGVDAVSDNKEAGTLRDKATREFDKAKRTLEQAREGGNSELESLGQLRVELNAQQMGRFASLFRELGPDVFVRGKSDLKQLDDADFSKQTLDEMRWQSAAAGEILGAGVATLGSGALAGVGSFGAATMLASASTGTAITTLSGVAATNATLAWFGGGSLAAGGLGIVGGTAVLGGIVAGPVLAVGGMLLAAKARENLANARRDHAALEKAVSEMNYATARADAIAVLARQFQQVSKQLGYRFTRVLDDLAAVIERKKVIERRHQLWLWLPSLIAAMTGSARPRSVSFRRLTEPDQRLAHDAWLFAQTFKAVLDVPLLTKEGAVEDEAGVILASGSGLILEDGQAPGAIVAGEGVALLEQRRDGP